MRQLFSIFVMTLTGSAAAASPIGFTGSIGPYQIEVELDRSDDQLEGRYRYVGREAWIGLSGQSYGQEVLQLEEQADGHITGQFHLEKNGDRLEGFWVDDANNFKVQLAPTVARWIAF
ncbi:MAG: hypothetical protein ACU0GG_14050 [Paracoccaceae bacterium]